MAGTLNANQIIPDQGQTLYINGIDYAANVVIGNTNTSIASFSPTGNVTVQGTITANGITSSSGNLTVSGAVTATGNVSANNISSSYDITASSFNGGQLAGMRNKIINGAMMIDQRNAGASVTPTASTYCLDRWGAAVTQSSKYSVQQLSTTALPGFTNYLAATSLSAYSVTATDYFHLYQGIEGLNIADLNWGTSSAAPVVLSFKVYSSLTGTFGGSLFNASANYSYPFTYSISSANTWTSISIAISGPTSGTWATNNTAGIYVNFGLGVGSTYSGTAGSWAAAQYRSATGATSVVGTNGATFYITGVQLEKGATATPFENRLYGTELALCQRYLPSYSGPNGTEMLMYGTQYPNTTNAYVYANFAVTTRVSPTGLSVSNAGHFRFAGTNANMTITSMSFSGASIMGAEIALTGTGGSSLQGGSLQSINASALLYFTGCEL